MNAEPIVIGIALAYLLLMIAIGVWANTKMQSSKEFLVAGQSLGFFVMAIATFSSIQSGWGMVGATGTVTTWGLGAFVSTQMLAPLGFTLAWFLLGGRLRRIAQRHQVYSIPDIVRVRYEGRAPYLAMSVAMVFGTIGYMTAQIVAAGVITSLLLGIPLATATWIGAIVVGAYTAAGGMLAAVWTDLVQGVLMIIVSIAVFVVAMQVGGGWGNTIETISGASHDFLTLGGAMPAVWIVANAVMIALGVIAQPQLVHKFLMLKSTRELRWGATVACVAYATTSFFVLGIGLATRAAVIDGRMDEPTSSDAVVTDFLAAFTGPVIAGIALTALLAAIMSSASSFITIGASAVVRDLAGSLGFRISRDLLAQRIASIVIVGASLGIGLYLSKIIYLLGAIGWAAFAAAIFGPIIFGIYWRRGTGIAATASIIIGLVLNIFLTVASAQGWYQLPSHILGGTLVIMAGILSYVILSFVTHAEQDERRFDELYLAPDPPGGATSVDLRPAQGAGKKEVQ